MQMSSAVQEKGGGSEGAQGESRMKEGPVRNFTGSHTEGQDPG